MNYLSSKFNFDRSENKLSQILSYKKKNPQFLDLTVSNPTLLFDYEYEKIQNAFATTSPFPYNPDPQGLIETRLALVNYYQTKSINRNVENFFLTTGTSEAMSFILKTICDSDSEILVPTPGYPLYEFLFTLENVTSKNYNLIPKESENPNKLTWEIDFETLVKSINKKTKAIVIVEPHNPTGSRLSFQDSKILKNILKEKNLILIIDEVFSDYNSDENLTDPFSEINSIYLNGLSKMLALPQMKLSWIYLNGDEEFLTQMKSGLEIVSDSYLSVNTPVQKCLPILLETKKSIQEKIKVRILNNCQSVQNILSSAKNIQYFLPDGGWYLLLKINTTLEDEDFSCSLLEKFYTYVYPGYMFDLENSCWLVISLLTPEEVLKEGTNRIYNFVNESK